MNIDAKELENFLRSTLEAINKGAENGGKYKIIDPIEFELAKKIAFFPRAIERAQEENAPHYIALYLEELAQIFNSFYQSISVQKTEDDNLKNSRLALIRAVRIVIENGLALLNICVPKKM